MRWTKMVAILAVPIAVGFFAADACAMYHPGMGRFIQRDPGPGGPSLYEYVEGGPVSSLDPSGLLSTANHVAVTKQALDRLGEENRLCGCDFRMSFYKGVISPDWVYLAEAGREKRLTFAVNAALTGKSVADYVDETLEPIDKKLWRAEKWVARKTLPGWGYGGLRAIRNWWRDTSFVTPAVDMAAKVVPQVKGTDVYQSHYGDRAWQHAMYANQMTAAQIQSTLVEQTALLIEQARDHNKRNECDKAAFALGKALHYLQDSWTPSHVARNRAGQITRFQDYLAQSPTLHAEADALNQYDAAFGPHVDRSVALIKVFLNDKIAGERLKTHLQENFYQMSKAATAGGTEGAYKPR